MDKLQFEPFAFIENLKYMGIGMLGVFMIVAIIMAATYLIMHFTTKPKKKPSTKEKVDE